MTVLGSVRLHGRGVARLHGDWINLRGGGRRKKKEEKKYRSVFYFLLSTEVLFKSFYFCFMYVSNVLILVTEPVFVSFYEQKSILTVVFPIKY